MAHLQNLVIIRSRVAFLTAAAALLILFGIADYLTPPELVSSILYLIPLFLVSWFCGRRTGLVFAGLSSLVGYLIHSPWLRPAPNQSIHFGNSAAAFTFFMLFSYILSTLKTSLDTEKLLARTDHVTGLANGRAFIEAVDREMLRSRRYGRPITVAYMDIDNFKKVNDTRGHAGGDALLRLTADTVQSALRNVDTCARVGGDEYAFLLPESDYDRAHKALERIRRELNAAVRRDRYGVSFSVGAVTCARSMCDGSSLVKMADDLMYTVKKSGKNGLQHVCMADEDPVPGATCRAAVKNDTIKAGNV